jgi:class 3 adenylate cyclase
MRTSYAVNDGAHIAWGSLGSGSPDLLFVTPTTFHTELMMEHPAPRAVFERFAAMGRLIVFDRRGTGLSDPRPGPQSLEEQMGDVRAVLDAAGARRPVLYAEAEGGAMALLFAATHPDRVRSLVLFHGFARLTAGDGYPTGRSPEEHERVMARRLSRWGDGTSGVAIGPVLAGRDPAFPEWWGRVERYGASPAVARESMALEAQIDVRAILRDVRVPTLVLCRPDAPWPGADHSRYLARHIPGARLVELPGGDGIVFGDGATATLDEVEAFVTGTRPAHAARRVLSTVLFTDIVGSTERAAALGDRRWRELLGHHDDAVRAVVARHAGRLVKSIGDGVLATFDGPARGVRAACDVEAEAGGLGLDVRAGLHTGEVELLDDEDVGGLAVHVAARVAAAAGAGEVLATSTVKDLVLGSGLRFDAAGIHELKGVPEPWPLFRVAGDDDPLAGARTAP